MSERRTPTERLAAFSDAAVNQLNRRDYHDTLVDSVIG